MSRLNDIIKLVFILGNSVFAILSISLAVASALALSGELSILKIPAAKSASAFVLVISTATLLCTFVGCCGAVNQIVRTG